MATKTVHIYLFLLGYALITVAGCSPKTANTDIPLDTPATFSYSGDQGVPDQWWNTFEDPKLNNIIDSALSSNFNLKTVWQQLKASQEVVERESSFLFPDLDASMQGAIQRPQPDYIGGESVQLGLNAFYEVDLWGRINARIEAERYRADASLLDYKTAAISLSAEITRSWYQLMAAHRQLDIAEDQIETNEQILTLLRTRYGNGQIRSVDILRQNRLLESTRDQKITMETRIGLLENRLTVLLGNAPQQPVNYEPDSLPELPPVPDTGIPIELIRRRPDVQSAFLRLQAADREVAVAISNQYPRLNISVSSSIRSNNINNLFQRWAREFSSNLVAPLLYGGRLRAEVDRTKAVKNQLLNEYGQSVLTAFREVENALVQEEKQKERIANLEEQLSLAERTYEQLRIEYFNGMADYLDVLNELEQQQQLRRDLISARLSLLDYRIGLYRALAGGFETARENEES